MKKIIRKLALDLLVGGHSGVARMIDATKLKKLLKRLAQTDRSNMVLIDKGEVQPLLNLLVKKDNEKSLLNDDELQALLWDHVDRGAYVGSLIDGEKFFELKEALSERNHHVVSMTDEKDIAALIDTLKPVSTDKKMIRLGPNGDGGYLVPDDLQGIEACFSPGVDCISGFEKDCANMGMKVFLADGSVDSAAEHHDLFGFTKKNVGITSNDDFMTIDDWVAMSLPESRGELMLQVDVEGYEYEVFMGMSQNLMNRLRIIVAEFHSLNELWNKPFFQLVSRVFEKIHQTHTCVHIHPNNCCGAVSKGDVEIPLIMELTFLRNDRINTKLPTDVFPHPLDYDNTENPALPLPPCWYKNA